MSELGQIQCDEVGDDGCVAKRCQLARLMV